MKISLSLILGWLFGLYAIFLGISALSRSLPVSALYIIAGLLVIPNIWSYLKSQYKLELTLVLRIVLAVIVYLIAVALGSQIQ